MHKDLREFAGLLNSHKVEFIVVGGHAVAFHGYPRFTGDVDFLVRPNVANAARLMAVLQAFGFGGAGCTAEDLVQPNRVVQMGAPPNRIDLLTSISGVTFEEAWESRVLGELDGIATPFLSKDLLVRNKRAAARPKDLADVAALESGSR